MKENINKFIIERIDMPEPRFDVKGILTLCGMNEYGVACCNRIVDESLVDGEHIDLSYIDAGNLYVDKIGLLACSGILTSYIEKSDLTKLVSYISVQSQKANEYNKYFALIRGFSRKTLRKTINEITEKKDLITDWDEKVQQLRLELKSRGFIQKKRIAVRNALSNAKISVKYRHVFRIMKRCIGN